jgi:hypothetical protein
MFNSLSMNENTSFVTENELLTHDEVTPSYEDAQGIIKKLYQIANTGLMQTNLALALEAIKEIIEFKGYKEAKKIILISPEENVPDSLE